MTNPGTVLVVGSLHYDIVVEADHLPRKDETAVGSRWFPKFGGKGGNQAVSVSLHGAKSRMVSAVGDDAFGPFLRGGLQANGVDHRFVATIPGVGSGMSVAIMDASGDYAATIVSGTNLLIAQDVLQDSEVWRDVGLLVLQNEIPEPINIAAAQAARERGIKTLLNAAPARGMSVEFARLVDILVVNAVEAEMMGAEPIATLADAAAGAETLSAHFETVVVTAGSLGLAAWTASDERFSLAAEKITVVSSHGAGDAFIGALAAQLVNGADFRSACGGASHAAAEHVAGRSPKKAT